jgi:hypothetical protein
MASSYESIIFPDSPLVMVHRDWKRTPQRTTTTSLSPPATRNRFQNDPLKGQSVFQTTSESPPATRVFAVEKSVSPGSTVELKPEQIQNKTNAKAKRVRNARQGKTMTEFTAHSRTTNQSLATQPLQPPLPRNVPSLSTFHSSNSIDMNHYVSYCTYSKCTYRQSNY